MYLGGSKREGKRTEGGMGVTKTGCQRGRTYQHPGSGKL